MYRWARSRDTRKDWLSPPNRSRLTCSRRNACVTRSPATFSAKSALTAATRSRDSLYARDDLDRNTSVATTSTGKMHSTARPSRRLMMSSAASTPKKVSTELTMVTSPVCRKVDSASTSVVILVRIRPDISRS